MERLNKWNESSYKHAYYPRCFKEPCYGSGCKIKDCPFETAVCERLAAYEDTGLTPEAVETVKLALAAKHLVDLETLNNTPISRLVELAEADKDGRCVVLPCRVGEKIYYLNGKYIIEVDVVGYKIDETGAWLFIGETYNPETNRAYHCDLETERIGKTVFLTREEAERAMEGRKDE